MQPERLNFLLVFSWVVTVVLSPMVWVMVDGRWAWGVFFGGAWSSANIWVLMKLIQEIMGPCRPLWVLSILSLKLPVLYGAGFFVFMLTKLSVVAAVIGFHIPFAVFVVDVFFSLGNLTKTNQEPD